MRKGRILLVDDEPQIVRDFELILKTEGYEVDKAFSGEQAWEMYLKVFYHVVVVDWRLGRMSGMDLLKRISETHPFTHVIMITAFQSQASAIEAHHYHAFDYLCKPVNPPALLAKIKEALDRRDPLIEAMEEWIEQHPQEASMPFMAVEDSACEEKIFSIVDILEQIKRNTSWGRKERENIIQAIYGDLMKETTEDH
jgi:DNA-binding response OmpR family regulator